MDGRLSIGSDARVVDIVNDRFYYGEMAYKTNFFANKAVSGGAVTSRRNVLGKPWNTGSGMVSRPFKCLNRLIIPPALSASVCQG